MKKAVFFFGLLVLSLSFTASSSEKRYFGTAGKINEISSQSMILSDRYFKVSSLVSCFDIKGKRLVTCSSLKPNTWVKVSLEGDYPGVITEIRVINQSDARKRY
jgi:hypothetical protein